MGLELVRDLEPPPLLPADVVAWMHTHGIGTISDLEPAGPGQCQDCNTEADRTSTERPEHPHRWTIGPNHFCRPCALPRRRVGQANT